MATFSQLVARWTPNRLAIDGTLSPDARAVRMASTSFSESGVRDRLVGFATTPASGVDVGRSSLPQLRFACSHAELSRSNRFHVFGLSPPASTNERPRQGPFLLVEWALMRTPLGG